MKTESIDPRSLSLLGEGRTAEVFLFDEKYVIKLFRPDFPRQAIDNEYLVCRSVGSAIDMPAAHQRLVISGRDAIVFDFVKGNSGFKYLLRSPWNIEAFAKEFAGLHAKIHAISAHDDVPGLKGILLRNLGLQDILPPETRRKIARYLEDLPDGRMLCHGDFHPENILISGKKSFVLDWMTASSGDPAADVARTSILLKWAEPGPGIPAIVRVMLGTIRKKFYKQYLSEYLRMTGLRQDLIDRWELPVLAARLMEWLPEGEKRVLVEKINERLKRL